MSTPSLDRLLSSVNDFDASDLHLVAGVPPAYRVNGEIIIADEDALTVEDITEMADSLLNDLQKKKFEQEWELCISLLHSVAGRVRMTFYRRNGHPEMSFRFCGDRISSREELGLPKCLDELARKPNGLVLITGPTGAGKTTTLNYLIDLINNERRCKIVTIEDPIEFVHQNKRAIVVQQEVLTDVHSFNRALIHVLRQDPDVIVVGEMRDPETMRIAVAAAETGHLVLSTLHTTDVASTVGRIADSFPVERQNSIRQELAMALAAVLTQILLPSKHGGRLPVAELLMVGYGARHHIRRNALQHLHQEIPLTKKKGSFTMEESLVTLVKNGDIEREEAQLCAIHPDDLEILLKGAAAGA
jgi:twitching motility protein PilT